MNKITNPQEMFNLSLNQKIDHSLGTIEEFYNKLNGKVYISFSGGKDSTVLLFLVRKLFPNTKAVFVDTGLEFPEIRNFVKSIENVDWLKPKKTFLEIFQKYGFPYPSKQVARYVYEIKNCKNEKTVNFRLNSDGNNKNYSIALKWNHLLNSEFKITDKCCYHLKKAPMKQFNKISGLFPYVGIMAEESRIRFQTYVKHGCNSFSSNNNISRPLSIWNDSDIWNFIKQNNISYSNIYKMGYNRTGCMFCLFGIGNEKSNLFEKNRLQKMKETHPKIWNYIIYKLNYKKLCDAEKIFYY